MNDKLKSQMESMLASAEIEGIYADEKDRQAIMDVLDGNRSIEDLIDDLKVKKDNN